MQPDERPQAWLEVDPLHPDPAILARAAEVLRGGGLVAFPTETVYGLGAIATDPAAVARIFAAKGRPADNPLIVHVTNPAMARRVVTEWPPVAQRLAERFWPGPLTLVLPKGGSIPNLVTAGLPAVGVRAPAHPVARALIEATGMPLAAPSANPYMSLSPTTAEHVWAGLQGKIDLLVDAGPTEVGIESTVLDLTGEVPTLLRPGGVSRDALLEVLPQVRLATETMAEGPRLSPGLARRHYAPVAPLERVDRAEVERAALEGSAGLALLTLEPALEAAPGVLVRTLPAEPGAYARGLYAALHAFDAGGARRILAERPPETEAWRAVNDRLSRAAER